MDELLEAELEYSREMVTYLTECGFTRGEYITMLLDEPISNNILLAHFLENGRMLGGSIDSDGRFKTSNLSNKIRHNGKHLPRRADGGIELNNEVGRGLYMSLLNEFVGKTINDDGQRLANLITSSGIVTEVSIGKKGTLLGFSIG